MSKNFKYDVVIFIVCTSFNGFLIKVLNVVVNGVLFNIKIMEDFQDLLCIIIPSSSFPNPIVVSLNLDYILMDNSGDCSNEEGEEGALESGLERSVARCSLGQILGKNVVCDVRSRKAKDFHLDNKGK